MAKQNMQAATTLTHVAALLQIIFTILGFLALIGIGVLGFATRVGFGAFIGTIGIIGLILGIIWSWIDYSVIYYQVKRGRYPSVSDTMLVVGILQLFLGGTIPGILLIVAWAVARS